MNIILNGFRIGHGTLSGVIVFHNGTHLCQIFSLRDHLFLVLLQCVLDPLGETVVIGRIFLILFANAAGQFAGNSICLCSKRSQLLQFPLKIILVQNIDGAGDLFQTSYGEVRIQKILHQRLIFPVINCIAVTDFHATAYLGEKDKSVLILLQFIFRNGCIRLFRIQNHIQRFAKSTEEIIKVLSLLIVSKKHFHFFGVAWIFQVCKQFCQPSIGFPQASHR